MTPRGRERTAPSFPAMPALPPQPDVTSLSQAAALPSPFPKLLAAIGSTEASGRRAIPLSTSLRALTCVPNGFVVCAAHRELCPAATCGSDFTIESGSDFVIGLSTALFEQTIISTKR
jgi:hypothetical protein